MSDDQVKRYQLDYHHTQTYAEMAEDCDGDWVKYKDYKDAADRIEELEAENKHLRLEVVHANDAADVAINQVRILVGILAKAVAERDEDLNQIDSARHTIDVLKTFIKELKGQDDD